MSALDFNGAIAVRLFILSHFTYVKGICLYLQRTASAFGCVLRGATGDVVLVGGRVRVTSGKASIRAMKDVWYVLSIDYKFSMNNIIEL